MWLLLRRGVSPEGIAEALAGVGVGAQAHQVGDRWVVAASSNGILPEALLRWEAVEQIWAAPIETPLVSAWEGTVQVGRWKRGQEPLLIAGPCSVESRDSLLVVAQALQAVGVHALRGGAFKARTSPYAFQGLGEKALDWLLEARALTGLPLCVEVLSEKHLPLYEEIDILQVGARNMDDYWLLKEVGALRKPVLLKRNPQATLEEFLLAAEYLLLHGAPWVLLCERGIRTFDRSLRYTLDVGALSVLKQRTKLPVGADPSHAAGRWMYVEPLALAAVAAGAEALLIEVHPEPLKARSDAPQQLTVEQYARLVEKVKALYAALSPQVS